MGRNPANIKCRVDCCAVSGGKSFSPSERWALLSAPGSFAGKKIAFFYLIWEKSVFTIFFSGWIFMCACGLLFWFFFPSHKLLFNLRSKWKLEMLGRAKNCERMCYRISHFFCNHGRAKFKWSLSVESTSPLIFSFATVFTWINSPVMGLHKGLKKPVKKSFIEASIMGTDMWISIVSDRKR